MYSCIVIAMFCFRFSVALQLQSASYLTVSILHSFYIGPNWKALLVIYNLLLTSIIY
jgi:hypothetical protein